MSDQYNEYDGKQYRYTQSYISSNEAQDVIDQYMSSADYLTVKLNLIDQIASHLLKAIIAWRNTHKSTSQMTSSDCLKETALLGECISEYIIISNRKLFEKLILSYPSNRKSGSISVHFLHTLKTNLSLHIDCLEYACKTDSIDVIIHDQVINKNKTLDVLKSIYQYRNMVSHPLKDISTIHPQKQIVTDTYVVYDLHAFALINEVFIGAKDNIHKISDLIQAHDDKFVFILNILKDALGVSPDQEKIEKGIRKIKSLDKKGIKETLFKAIAAIIPITLIIFMSFQFLSTPHPPLDQPPIPSLTPETPRQPPQPTKSESIANRIIEMLSSNPVFKSHDERQRFKSKIQSKMKLLKTELTKNLIEYEKYRAIIKSTIKESNVNKKSQFFIRAKIKTNKLMTQAGKIKERIYCSFKECKSDTIKMIQKGSQCAEVDLSEAPETPETYELLCFDLTHKLYIQINDQITCEVAEETLTKRLNTLTQALSECTRHTISIEYPPEQELAQQLTQQEISVDD